MRAIAIGVICSVLSMGASDVFAGQEAAAWHAVAAAIPLGSKVTIQTAAGDRMSGTLMSVSRDGVLLKKGARRPEPAVTVAFTDIARLERDHGDRFNVGKAIAVGLAAGAGVVLSLFAIALQFD